MYVYVFIVEKVGKKTFHTDKEANGCVRQYVLQILAKLYACINMQGPPTANASQHVDQQGED